MPEKYIRDYRVKYKERCYAEWKMYCFKVTRPLVLLITDLFLFSSTVSSVWLFEKEIHSFSSMSHEKSKASSKASSPHSAI